MSSAFVFFQRSPTRVALSSRACEEESQGIQACLGRPSRRPCEITLHSLRAGHQAAAWDYARHVDFATGHS
jgi:hypothetical protein